MTSLLRVADLVVCYGGIRAVQGVDFSIDPGEVISLIGANGAGKSTLLRALAGLESPTQGRIHYQERDITTLPAHRRVNLGMALVPEGRGIFPRLTVEENLLIGAYGRHDRGAIRGDVLRGYQLFPRLGERPRQLAGTLSGGEQQMLAIARALMSRPRLLLLDEPSMGLAPLMVRKIFETVSTIAAEGVTLLLVEQNARMALEVSQRGLVLEGGRIRLSGAAATLIQDPRVKAAYLGG